MILRQSAWTFTTGLVIVTLSANVAASGFALIEQSASGMGNAYAGGAASAEDASTIFFNPAGMSRLSGKQVALAAHAIKPSAKFSDSASVSAAFQSVGGNGGDAGGLAVVPNAYFSMEINPQVKFGFGVNTPFGLQTEYDSTWIGRFQAVKSKIQTVNLNPSLSFQVSDVLSIGAGLNYQRIDGELTSAVNYAAAVFSASGSAAAAAAAVAAGEGEGFTTISGDDTATGYNLGLLYNASPQTRLGLAYRSKVKYTLSGTVNFSDNRPTAATLNPAIGAGPAAAAAVAAGIAAATANGEVTLPITMPDSFSMSGVHQLNDKWEILADATWTGWSVLQQLQINRSNGTNLLTVQENWKDTWRFSVGANHRYNGQWTSRIGLAYDQSPVPDAYRTARIPDNDRTWLALGGQYKPSGESAVNFGYVHLFVKDSTIADMQSAGGKGDLIGTYKNSVNILSVQYTQSF